MKSQPALLGEAQPWLDWLLANGRSVTTVVGYRRALCLTARYWSGNGGPKCVHAITLADLESWATETLRRGYAPGSRDRFLRPWTIFLRWLEERGGIFNNPARNFRLPDTPRRMVPVPSEREVARFLNSVEGRDPHSLRDRAMLEVTYATGMRRGELVALRLDSVNFDDRVVAVCGKGGKERVLPLTFAATAALRAYLDDGRPALVQDKPDEQAMWLRITAGRGRPIRHCAVERMFAVRSKAAGLHLSAHDLRRACATHLLRRGFGVNELRILLGHSGFQHVRHYVRYAAVDLQRAHRKSKLAR